MDYLLADPGLSARSGGEEFARVAATSAPGEEVVVRLRASLPALFPLAQARPRYTVRHLLKVAVPTADPAWYVSEAPGGGERDDDGLDYRSMHESRLIPVLRRTALTEISVSVPVPPELARDPALLAAFVDYRVIVRLGTVENQVLLHGSPDGAITGLLALDGLRQVTARGDLAADVAAAAASVESTGGSCDAIVVHPQLYWQLVAAGLLDRLGTAGVRVSRTRMIAPGQALLGDFRAAVTLLDPATSSLALRYPDGIAVIEASTRIGLAVHLPQHFVLMQPEPGPAGP
jgi:hypothetical protein